jgi:hypothetical protein
MNVVGLAGDQIAKTSMPFYRDHIYPCLVNLLGNPGPIKQIRQRLVPLAQGKVLEVGVGSGVNFAHYDPAKVSKVYALEPNAGMIRLAERQGRRTEVDVEFWTFQGNAYRVQLWQRWWEPFHHCVFQGCHLTRDIPALITQGGFRIEQMETDYLVKFPKSWAYCWWGVAIPQRR